MDLVFIGVVVSLAVQFLKKQFGTGEYTNLIIVAVVSLVAAALYTYFVAVGYWQTVANVIVLAGAFYTYIIARFK